MITHMFSVFDSKVGAYAAPFHSRARGEAVRSFQVACQDDAIPFKKHPADYSLWYLGEYDDNDAGFKLCKPERVIGADEF